MGTMVMVIFLGVFAVAALLLYASGSGASQPWQQKARNLAKRS
jgi:hypothetical protein